VITREYKLHARTYVKYHWLSSKAELKVARSLADLEKASYPELSHYQEALSYRPTMYRRTGD